MYRAERVVDWVFYHVYNRGNNRQQLFFNHTDYAEFIGTLKSTARRYDIDVPIYTVMPNHYHMLVQQRSGGSLASMMEVLGTAIAMSFNERRHNIGHAFQGPYKYKSIGEEAIWHVASYIHLNPVRAGLTIHPADWGPSNYAAYSRSNLTSRHQLRGGIVEFGKDYVSFVEGIVADEGAMRDFWGRIKALGNIGGSTGRYHRGRKKRDVQVLPDTPILPTSRTAHLPGG